jgi:hypothetical protein
MAATSQRGAGAEGSAAVGGGAGGRADSVWWGGIDVPRDGVVRFAAGPMQVWVERRRHDWRVFNVASHDPDAVGRAAPPAAVTSDDLPDSDPVVRFAFADAPGRLVVSVAQADRPFVIRPATPFSVGPGERVTLFVSTPAWMVLAVERIGPTRLRPRPTAGPQGEPQRLTEFPLERASDTWFGPNTLAGELCYAARTAGYLSLDDVPRRPHLVVTPVIIENKVGDPLEFERVQVPLPLLGVYVDTTGALWTNAVRLTRDTAGGLAAVRVESGVPTGARGASERLTKPRSGAATSSVVRAFSRLLQMGATGS